MVDMTPTNDLIDINLGQISGSPERSRLSKKYVGFATILFTFRKQSILELTSVTKEDDGKYKCQSGTFSRNHTLTVSGE